MQFKLVHTWVCHKHSGIWLLFAAVSDDHFSNNSSPHTPNTSEALAADWSVVAPQFSFCTLTYPALVITYFGQASWLLHNPDGYATVFYSCAPEKVFWPVFVISVATAVVASQVGCVGWAAVALSRGP